MTVKKLYPATNTALCISVVVVIIIVCLPLIPRRWFWVWEVLGATLVAVGCCGELYLFNYSAGDAAGHGGPRRKMELIFITMVALGVTMECAGLQRTIPEALRHEKEIEDITQTNLMISSNNLILRSNLLALEQAVQWRTITPGQEKSIVEVVKPVALRLHPTNQFIVHVHQATDFEASRYGKILTRVLQTCGLNARLAQPGISFSNPENLAEDPTGLIINERQKIGEVSVTLAVVLEAFRNAKVTYQATIFTNEPPDGIVTIRVLAKPER